MAGTMRVDPCIHAWRKRTAPRKWRVSVLRWGSTRSGPVTSFPVSVRMQQRRKRLPAGKTRSAGGDPAAASRLCSGRVAGRGLLRSRRYA